MKDTKQNIQGEPMKCIWMEAGVVDFKLCHLEFDCEHCSFDRALRGQMSELNGLPVTDSGFRLDPSSFYARTHVWVRVEEEGRVRIGLDDFGQRLTGRIYSIQLPPEGRTVHPQTDCWSITHGYGDSPLGAAVDGTVLCRNEKLLQMPSLINSDPYGEGWVLLVEPDHLMEDLRMLHYGKSVRTWYAEEAHRLRNLLEGSTNPAVTLQDGGLPVEDLTSNLNLEIINMFLHYEPDVRNQQRR